MLLSIHCTCIEDKTKLTKIVLAFTRFSMIQNTGHGTPLYTQNVIEYLIFFLRQMYGLIWLTQIPSRVQDCDVLVMLTSALCHDLDHPGYNNAYQVGVILWIPNF